MSIRVSFRSLLVAVAAVGLALGAAFGAGIAYGRSDPKEAPAGQTAAQVQAQLGLGGAQSQVAGAAGGAGGTQGAQGGAAAQAAARSASGRITAISGQSVTIETRTGSLKLNLAPATTVSKLGVGTLGDLKEGMVVTAGGQRRDDGSFDATTVTEVPPDLAGLVAGTGGSGGGAGAASTPPAGGTGR